MNTKEIIKEVRNLVFGEEKEVKEFADYKTNDGIVLRCDELAEGNQVSIISEDGENVSGAATYVLEDGKTIEVGEDGVIVSVADSEPIEEEVEEVMESEELKDEKCEDKYSDRIAKLEDGMDRLLSMFSKEIDAKDDLEKEVSELKTELEEFKKAPAQEEIVIGKKQAKANKRSNTIEQLRKFRK